VKIFLPFGPATRANPSETAPLTGNGSASEAQERRAPDDLNDLKNQVEAMRKELAELARERK